MVLNWFEELKANGGELRTEMLPRMIDNASADDRSDADRPRSPGQGTDPRSNDHPWQPNRHAPTCCMNMATANCKKVTSAHTPPVTSTAPAVPTRLVPVRPRTISPTQPSCPWRLCWRWCRSWRAGSPPAVPLASIPSRCSAPSRGEADPWTTIRCSTGRALTRSSRCVEDFRGCW